jgi:hypothetical protein
LRPFIEEPPNLNWESAIGKAPQFVAVPTPSRSGHQDYTALRKIPNLLKIGA